MFLDSETSTKAPESPEKEAPDLALFTKRHRIVDNDVTDGATAGDVGVDEGIGEVGSLFGRAPYEKATSLQRSVETFDDDDDDDVIKRRVDIKTTTYDAISLTDRRSKFGKKCGATFLDIVSARSGNDRNRKSIPRKSEPRLFPARWRHLADEDSVADSTSRGSSFDLDPEDDKDQKQKPEQDKKPLIQILD